MAQMVKNQPAIWEAQVRPLGQEDLLEKGMAIHSSILYPLQYSCLENSTDRGAGQATVHGLQRLRHDRTSHTHTHTHTHTHARTHGVSQLLAVYKNQLGSFNNY